MTDTPTIEQKVHVVLAAVAAGHCWVLRDPDTGKPLDSDGLGTEGDPHYDGRDGAQAKVRFLKDTDGLHAVPVLLPHPCHTVDCAECDTYIDEDEAWTCHFDTAEEAAAAARSAGWTVRAGGDGPVYTCPECQANAPEPEPDLIPGQTVITLPATPTEVG